MLFKGALLPAIDQIIPSIKTIPGKPISINEIIVGIIEDSLIQDKIEHNKHLKH
jgi:hypothetical protein